jgi:hypothetical protein
MADDTRTDDERKQDEQKRVAQAEDDRKAREKAEADRQKEMKETPLVADAAGNVMIEAIMGPYRGQRLTVKEAEGSAAINDHWARNPVWTEYQHDELSEEERKSAWDASHAWATATWEAAGQEPDETPPPEGGEARKRAMTPEPQHGGAGYATRGTAEPSKPAAKR